MKLLIQRLTLFAAMLMSVLSMSAAFEVDGLYYEVSDGKTVTLVRHPDGTNHYSGNIQIPDKVKCNDRYFIVDEIDSYAFYGCEAMTAVTIPNSVTQIGSYAFYGCSALTSVSIPNSVTQIGSYAFYGCTALTAINVDSKNQDYCSDNGILYNKAKTELVIYPEGKTDSSFTVPNTVTSLCLRNLPGLTSLNIPNSVTDLTLWSLPGLTELNISNSATYLTLYDLPGLTVLNITNSVTKLSLSNLSGLTALNIPNSVTDLDLTNMPGLTALNIPNSVTDLILTTMPGLTSLNIPNSVTYLCLSDMPETSLPNIPNSVTDLKLINMNGITSLNVPNTVKNLELYHCTSLETVDLQEGALQSVDFSGCSALTSVNIPDCVTNLFFGAFVGCTSLTRVKLPKGLTEIPSYTFDGCKSLTKISRLPATVTKIGGNAFYGCRSLEEIEIPAGVTEIPKGTFCGCRSLKTIEMPGVTKIGDMAFACCPNLTLNIPNSITDLGKCAIGASAITFDCTTIPSYVLDFEDRKFDAITIGKNVYDIEDKALRFRRLTSLSVLSDFECGDENFNSFDFDCRVDRIYCPMNTPPDCFGLQFTDETYSYGQLFVPQGTESKYSKVDPWRNFINVTEMDAGVDSIADESIVIKGHNGCIVITGAADNAIVEVYDIASTAAYRGTGKTVSGLPGGVYIVRVSGKTAKVRI